MTASVPLSVDRLLNEAEAAQALSVPVKTLQNWRCTRRKDSPPFVKLGALVRYKLSDLERYVKRQTIVSE